MRISDWSSDVCSSDLATVQEGQVIEAQAAAFPDHPVRGKVQTIDPVVNPATRAVTIRAILPNPDLRLKPGMLLTVQLEAGAHTALSVPELAVLGDGEDRFVYIVDDQGKAQRTEVRPGARRDVRPAIESGKASGRER